MSTRSQRDQLRRIQAWTLRIVVVLVSAVSLLACTTIYETRHPRAVGEPGPVDEVIAHCLASAGLDDRSSAGAHASSIAAEPALVAIWATPERSRWSRTQPGSTAAVRVERGGWHVTFIPTAQGTSAAAQAHSEAFARCVELHSPGVAVRVDSRQVPGLVQ